MLGAIQSGGTGVGIITCVNRGQGCYHLGKGCDSLVGEREGNRGDVIHLGCTGVAVTIPRNHFSV